MMKSIKIILMLVVALVMGAAVLFTVFAQPENEERILACVSVSCTEKACAAANMCCNYCACERWQTKDKEGLEAVAVEGALPSGERVVDGCGHPQRNVQALGFKKENVFYVVKWSLLAIPQNLFPAKKDLGPITASPKP